MGKAMIVDQTWHPIDLESMYMCAYGNANPWMTLMFMGYHRLKTHWSLYVYRLQLTYNSYYRNFYLHRHFGMIEDDQTGPAPDILQVATLPAESPGKENPLRHQYCLL